jgi:hypothetical protein
VTATQTWVFISHCPLCAREDGLWIIGKRCRYLVLECDCGATFTVWA